MFAQLQQWVGDFLSGYVEGALALLNGGLLALASTWLTVYVVSYGLAAARGEVPEPMSLFAWKMVKLVAIISLATVGSVYGSVVVATADGLQDGMATVFVKAGYAAAAPGSAAAALDQVNEASSQLLATLWHDAGIWRLDLVLASMIFSVGVALFLVVGAYVVLLAKVVLAFGLVVGPMAILALMFKASARFCDAWVSFLLGAVVLSWFVFFALGLSLFVVDKLLAAAAASGGFVEGGEANGLEVALTFTVIASLLSVVLYQAPTLAAALTGGSSVQLGYQMVSNTLLAARAGAALFGSRGRGTGPGGSVRPGGLAHGAGQLSGRGARWTYQSIATLGRRT